MYGPMVIPMTVSVLRIESTGMACTNTVMGSLLKAIIKTIRCMVVVSSHGMMVRRMMGNGTKGFIYRRTHTNPTKHHEMHTIDQCKCPPFKL
jgi:hypothetical protein